MIGIRKRDAATSIRALAQLARHERLRGNNWRAEFLDAMEKAKAAGDVEPMASSGGGDEKILAELLGMLRHHTDRTDVDAVGTLRRLLETRTALAIENDKLARALKVRSRTRREPPKRAKKR